jgi:hypothetical protein
MIFIDVLSERLSDCDEFTKKKIKKIVLQTLSYSMDDNTDDVRFKSCLNDEQCSEMLSKLNKIKHNISYRNYVHVWYYIWSMYNGCNRKELFKHSLNFIESNSHKIDDVDNVINDSFDVYRVGTVDGRSWNHTMNELYEFYKCWNQNYDNHGTLKPNVYKRTVSKDDILIICNCNNQNESEVILKEKSIKNYSTVEKLTVDDTNNSFVLTDKSDVKLCGYRFEENGEKLSLKDIDSDSTLVSLVNEKVCFENSHISDDYKSELKEKKEDLNEFNEILRELVNEHFDKENKRVNLKHFLSVFIQTHHTNSY